MTYPVRLANNAALLLGLMLAACLGFGGVAHAQGQAATCDPTKATCVPAPGSGGAGCTPLKQALGQCTPGDGGGGIGGGGGAAPMCSAPPGGNPSCGGGPATTASSGPSSGAGNPINLLNGNKYQEESDLAALPGVLGLELRRYYNSQGNHPGLLGANWRMSYEAVLYDFGSQIQILQADGRRLMFQRGIGAHAALCTSPQPQDGQVRIEASSSGGPPTYHWRWADGRTLSFSGGSGGGHPLQAITAATGERLTLGYSPSGELNLIRDPQGRSLVFIYASPAEMAAHKRSRALKAIDTPLGRLTYTQDALGRLTEVAQAKDAASTPFLTRLYHYETRYNAGHPLALTGISIEGIDPQTHQSVLQRLSTYAYNADGQAILSTKGTPKEMKDGQQLADTGIEQVEVQYVTKALPYDSKVDRKTGEANPTRLGRAILTNSLGQQTQVTSAVIGGHFRLVEMRGAGCSTCGEPNMRYAYDSAGLLLRSTQIDSAGRPVRSEVTELDKYGRTVRTGVQAYTHGQAALTHWMERYEYPDVTYKDGSVAVAPRPGLIARPSVIAGKEHTVAMSYDASGQVTKVTESGFSPVNGKAQASPDGTLISRSTTHTYRSIDGRSVIQRIDGSPDSGDVTRFDWDAAGNFITAVTLPGNLVTREQRDPVSGRPTLRTDAIGVGTRFEYAQATTVKPSLVERAGQITRYRFDILSRPVRIDQLGSADVAAHRGEDQRSEKSVDLHYDAGGRLTTITDTQGYKAQTTLDAEGQPLVAGLYEPQQVLPLRATYRWYDDQRRLAKQLQADGRIDTWTYDQTGRVLDHLDGDDVLHLQRTNAAGAGARIDLAPDGLMKAALVRSGESGESGVAIGARTLGVPQLMRDDFGRVVIEWRPEQGLTLRTYDDRDHLVRESRLDRSAQPAGRVEQAFDAAGRMTRRQSFDAQGRLKETMESVYAGALLKEQRNDAQDTVYEHDASGRIVATRITLHDEHGRPAYATTLRSRYDSQGDIDAKTLADGQVMRVQRLATGTASRMSLQSAFWSNARDRLERWLPHGVARLLQGWLPEPVVVRDIDFHPYNGITGYTSGNDLRTESSFDIAGRVTAIRTGAAEGRRLSYAVGPRIRAIDDEITGMLPVSARYDYDGFGAMKTDAPKIIRTALNPYASDARHIDRDALGRTSTDASHRYTYTPSGQVETVDTVAGIRVASYWYNAAGQRVRKSVRGRNGTLHTTYFLWSDARLVAEIDGEGEHAGQVSAQYLYLGSGGKLAPVAKLEAAWAEGNPIGTSRILYIHADHRGAPTALTDANRHLVWRARPDAWGFVNASDAGPQEAVMNIRLPGQYFDAETGLHDNWHRTYDGRPDSHNKGSYLSPDPMGYPDGPNPYAYVGGDPINRIDPTGLYEEDVHYYMTYFLAVVAGLSADDALTIASANRYIDDNPNTEPYGTWGTNFSARSYYHFTQSGWDTTTNAATRYINPSNPQIVLLHNYATTQPALTQETEPTLCARKQFYGEYLHAYEDTYAHRDQNNVPYGDLIGHVTGGHNPDYTYDHVDLLGRNWQYNEARTNSMESAVFELFKTDFGTTALVSWNELESTVEGFNKDKSTEANINAKVLFLDDLLEKLKLPPIPKYNCDSARTRRNSNLKDVNGTALKQSDYAGTILATPAEAQSCK